MIKKPHPNFLGKPNLADQAYETLEEMIITLEFEPGAALSENSLAEFLNISRTPVREALQRLAGEGLVVILPKRGIFVSEPNFRTHLRLLELRREIQRLLVRLAAERATEEQKIQFAATSVSLIEVANSRDEVVFSQLDRKLDEQMWEAARNEFITKTMILMRGLSRRFWFQHYRRVGDLPLAAMLHSKIAEEIAKGSIEGAAAASDDLVDYIENFARDAVMS